ncbi:hypothetical protein K1719_041988 [Acacia pycnantha]|nr:hypothetical protein K1719_041988 [Acacia pycnantha]
MSMVRQGIPVPSFKYELLNVETDNQEEVEEVVLGQGDVVLGMNGGIPTVNFTNHVLDTLNKGMGLAIIVKLLGRTIGYCQLRRQLQNIWKSIGKLKLPGLDDDCFLVSRYGHLKDSCQETMVADSEAQPTQMCPQAVHREISQKEEHEKADFGSWMHVQCRKHTYVRGGRGLGMRTIERPQANGKRRILSRLRGIQQRLEDNPFLDSLIELDKSLQDEYEEVCFQEKLLWIHKSSSDWICLGDRNTTFYHTKALIRRNHNRVTQLKSDEGV